MTESEFNQHVAAIFAQIEQALDRVADDFDCSLNQGVLEIECADGVTVILNQHTPNREIWLAAKSGAFHFHYEAGRWLSRREGSELLTTLQAVLLRHGGVTVIF